MVLVVLHTMLFGLLAIVSNLLPLMARFYMIRGFRRGFMGLSALVLGIRYRVLGRENLPQEAAVILAKHQSAWETVALQDLIPNDGYAVFVLKKELMRQPFIGWGLGALRMISIDRASGREALNQVAEQGRDRLQQGFWVIIFPEGTRVAPGTTRRYKPGGAHLAIGAGAKVVPVAHDAGEFWPRNALIKCPGTVTLSIGPAIDTTGLTVEEVNQRAEAWIEGEMRRISPHRYPASVVSAVPDIADAPDAPDSAEISRPG